MRPSQYLNLDRREKAFIMACIQIRIEAEEKAEKKAERGAKRGKY